MANLLDQLKSMTTVVSDSGDINAIKQYKPTDSTTNPSLIAAAAQMPEYQQIVDDVLDNARKKLGDKASDEDVATPPSRRWPSPSAARSWRSCRAASRLRSMPG